MAAPTLTDLTGPITFLENTANVTPQLIDADVSFADADGDFNGGTLTVTGLLAEDRIAIQHQSMAAGQIGITATTVSYGGVEIGTYAGGNGATFTVTFNAAATAAAIDALIQTLTFATVSDTPGATRTLQLRVTDAAAETTGDLPITVNVTAENDAPQARISQYALVGAEILVNTATAGAQNTPRVVTLTDGNFVVVWQDSSVSVGGATGDTSSTAVKAQLFTVGGTPIGAEILVNTAISSTQQMASVSAVAGGGFVVTWNDGSSGVGGAGGDGFSTAVKAQLFGAGGVRVGTEFLVNSATEGAQNASQVATLAAGGGFVVTWVDGSLGVGGTSGDTSQTAVKAQVYTVGGVRVGNEILVNTAVDNVQFAPQITALTGGGFVITWIDLSLGSGGAGGDNNGNAIKAQVFGAGGAAVGTEILVNTTITGNQQVQVVTPLSTGGFVITWTDPSASGGDTSINAVRAQVFTAAGAPVGTEILVNTATSSNQQAPQIATLTGGGFVIAWSDGSLGVGGAGGDNNGNAVKLQIYANDGTRVGNEIRANTNITGSQTLERIVALTDGGFVVSWTDAFGGSGGATGDNASGSLKAQAFTATGVAVGGEILVNTAITGNQSASQLAALPGEGFVVTWADASAGMGGATRDTSGAAVKAQVFGTTYGVGFATTEQVALNLKGQLFVTDADGSASAVTATLSVASGILDVAAGMSGVVVVGSGTTSVTLTGTIVQIQALFATDATSAIVFTPNSDTTPASATLTLAVNDGTATATTTQAITIAQVNDAPSGTDSTRTIIEDTRYVLVAGDLAFTDPESHGLLLLTIVTLPSLGSLLYDADGPGAGAAVPVIAGQSFTLAEITGARLSYQGAANGNGAGYASLTFRVQDNGGVANGGADTDATPATLTFNVTAVDDPASLTGLVGGVTVSEATANGTPFRLDIDVAYIEPDSLTGGTLVLSGLLPEDRAGVFNLGNGAGQIGVSGATVSYGGVAIGTIAGGVGATLTVTFNAAATSAAVDALIQNLTYANASDTPTASRTLLLSVTDADGGTLPKVATFAQSTPAANPLNGIDVGFGSRAALLDVDRDGDLDIVTGQGASGLRYFRNNASTFAEVIGGGNPFSVHNFNFAYTAPVTADIDGDGDLDLIVGLDGNAGTPSNGQIRYFRNDGANNFAEQVGATNPFNGIDVGQGAAPGFVDIDGDGDLDAIVGERSGVIFAFRNDGVGVAMAPLTGAANPFNAITSGNGSYPVPTFHDLDGDGDLDAIIGRFDGILVSYRNNGPNTAFTVMTPNPTAGLAVSQRNAPTAGDVDGDGDIDLLVGNAAGTFTLLLNTPNPFVGINVNVIAQNDAPTIAGLANAVTFAENLVNATPQLLDADVTFADAEGNFTGSTLTVSELLAEDRVAIRNQGTAAGEIGVAAGNVTYGGMTIGTVTGGSGAALIVTLNAAASSVAVDALIQNLTYANVSDLPTATRTLALAIADAAGATFSGPASWVGVGSAQNGYTGNLGTGQPTMLSYIDVDNDGDLDPVVGQGNGTFRAFDAAIRMSDGVTVYIATGSFNPLNGIDVGDNAAPAAFDIDRDGQMDLIVGAADGTLRAYRNTGVADTAFVALTGTANPFDGITVGTRSAPGFVDLDGDGDLDAVVGNGAGTLLAYRNNGPDAAFTALTGTDNPFDGISVGANAVPAFVDLDNDGDLDALIGNGAGNILTYRNNGVGTAFTQFFGTSLDGVDVGSDAAPAMADFTRDGLLDLTIGRFGGTPILFQALADGSRPITVTVNAEPDVPALSGVATATIFAESAVNFAPRLLDADVSFTQPGGTYDGGTLTVSGLLAEDRVTVRPQGTATGQIGLTGTTVSYGGVAIGTVTGGIGATLTVTFNTAATAAAVDALIERLGYANLSNTPAAIRTLTITMTDSLAQQVGAAIAVTVTPENDATSLSGVTAALTYVENAAPLLIDSAVVLADAEGNVGGGTLTLSGLLAEDRVAVLDQGTGAGQIGVTGADVSYEGTPIGTISGGVGATFTVALNGSATVAAVDALIQALTYANISDAPTATRTLVLSLTDSAGAAFTGNPGFTLLASGANPFNGLDVGTHAAPAFIDLDGDGDLDAVVGSNAGTMLSFRNDGASFTALTGAANPFDGLNVGVVFNSTHATPEFIDLDGDGDLDAVAGNRLGQLFAFRNDGVGTAFTPLTGAANPFDGITAGIYASPSFLDIDGDGDLDALIGQFSATGGVLAYRNNGIGSAFTPITGTDNPLGGINLGYRGNLAFVDLDGDGDLDAVAGSFYSPLKAYRNNGPGTAFTPLTGSANPFTTLDAGSIAGVSFADIDGDGDLDGVIGNSDGTLRVLRNDPAPIAITVTVTAVNDRPVVAVGATTLITYVENATPIVVDAAFTITDPDSPLRTVAVTIGGSTQTTDVLAFVNDNAGLYGNITGVYDVGTRSLTLTSSSGSASVAQFQAAARAVTFASTSDAPSAGTRTIGFFAQDTSFAGSLGGTAVRDLAITAVDDAPLAVADSGSVLENATTGLAVLTNDTDVDLGLKEVATINGATPVVGTPITLASGATVTLQANGTITYNPNGVFNGLVSAATALATGAANGSASDSFAYTLNGGSQATVTVTIDGVDSAGDRLRGGAGANMITGTGVSDYIDVSQGGADTASGGGGDDALYFGAAFGAGDVADGGAGTNDQLGLQGDYTGGTALTLTGTNVVGVEVVAALPGFSYAITTADDLIAAGTTLKFYAGQLAAGQNFTLDGSAESDGIMLVYGGSGTDRITTGGGNDGIYFGPGRYDAATDIVDGGGGTNDQLALDGSYSVTFTAANTQNIEVIALLRGVTGDLATYGVTLADSLLTGAQVITVFATAVETPLLVDGSAEATGGIRIFGGKGVDTLIGGGGADFLYGNLGNDTLTGNGGADRFHFANAPDPANVDTIADFGVAQGDRIELDRIAFGMTPGALDAGAFVIGTAALDADDRIIYDAATGTLWFDADGVGGAAAIQFATLTGAPTIGAAEFVIV